MWDEEEYGGLYGEPSDVDVIIQEARNKLESLLKDSVRTAMAEAKEAEARLVRLKNDIGEAEFRLKAAQEAISDKQAELDKIDRYRLPRGFAKKITDALIGGFAPGDTAWMLDGTYKSCKCPVCEGKKELVAIAGEKEVKIKCPNCCGDGTILYHYRYPEEVTIKEVSAKLSISSDRVSTWSSDVIGVYGYDREFRVDMFYKTREECQAVCNELNAKESEETGIKWED